MPGVAYVGPPDSNWSNGEIRPPAGMVVHIAEGSFQGTISWQRNPVADVSSYFVVSYAGEIVQMLDLDLMAWTQSAGNAAWVGVENEGFHTDQLTDAQVSANAQIFAWLRSVWPSVPALVTNSPNVGGLGWHGMGGAAWGNHPNCPGPANVALLPEILARATGGGPTPPAQGDDEMFMLRDANGYVVMVPGDVDPDTHKVCAYDLPQPATDAFEDFKAAGIQVRQVNYINPAFYVINPPAPACPDCNCAGGGDGVSADEVREIIREELDGTRLSPA